MKTFKSHQTHKKILIYNAALKVMARKGYHGTTVEEVARIAGVAKGTVYLYFRSKQSILEELIGYYFRRNTALLNRLRKKKMPAVKKLAVFVEEYLGIMYEHKEFFLIMERDKGELVRQSFDSIHGEKTRQLYDNLTAKLSAIFRQGIREHAFRRVDILRTANVLLFAIHAVCYQQVRRKKNISVKKDARWITDFMIRGIHI